MMLNNQIFSLANVRLGFARLKKRLEATKKSVKNERKNFGCLIARVKELVKEKKALEVAKMKVTKTTYDSARQLTELGQDGGGLR